MQETPNETPNEELPAGDEPVQEMPPEGVHAALWVEGAKDRRRRAAEMALSHAMQVYKDKTGVLSPGSGARATSVKDVARIHAEAVELIAEQWYRFLMRAEAGQIEVEVED